MTHEHLWAPWRMSYIKTLGQPTETPEKKPSCFLCDAATVQATEEAMRAHLVLLRDERGVLMLNRYPYSNGHLLVAPHEHVADLGDLTPAQRAGLMELTQVGCDALHHAMSPQGLNVGMNLGRCAGAGVPGHIHMHIVPRWQGDVNFIEVVGSIRIVPQALEESYDAIRHAIESMKT